MFLTPQQQPFFGGTYFPKEPRYGMPAFRDLLQRVAQYYREQGAEIAAQNRAASGRARRLVPQPEPGAMLDDSALTRARAALEKSFDADLRRLFRRAEISASDQHRALSAAVVRHRGGHERLT